MTKPSIRISIRRPAFAAACSVLATALPAPLAPEETRMARRTGQREDYLPKAMNDCTSGAWADASGPDLEAIAHCLARLP